MSVDKIVQQLEKIVKVLEKSNTIEEKRLKSLKVIDSRSIEQLNLAKKQFERSNLIMNDAVFHYITSLNKDESLDVIESIKNKLNLDKSMKEFDKTVKEIRDHLGEREWGVEKDEN